MAVKKVRLSPVKKQLLEEVTASTRSGTFSCPSVGREVCSTYIIRWSGAVEGNAVGSEVCPINIIRWSGAVEGNAVHVVLHSLMLQGDDNDMSSPLWMVRTLGNSYRVAAACYGFVVVCMMFECMDVGCSTMPGFTNINDISSPLWMVRTPGNSVGVAIS